MGEQVLSVVVPVRNASPYVAEFVNEIVQVVSPEHPFHEIVLVDDGSTDDTVDVLEELLAERAGIRVISLSRPMGEDIAITAGLEQVIGDVAVTISPGSDPPSMIPALLDRLRGSTRIVVGVRSTRRGQGWVNRAGAWIFYRLTSRMAGVRLPRDATQFRAMDRKAVNAMLRIKDRLRHLRLLALQTGYAIETVSYEPTDAGGGSNERAFSESLSLAVDMSVAMGRRPLRFVSVVGILGSIANLIYASYVIAIFIFKNQVAEGWTTLSLEISLMFFLLFALLAVLCEYIGHILLEIKDRPLYVVTREFSSTESIPTAVPLNVVSAPAQPASDRR